MMPLGTHPPISVGIGPSEQGMENNDCLVQVPDEHPLERKHQINVSCPCLRNLLVITSTWKGSLEMGDRWKIWIYYFLTQMFQSVCPSFSQIKPQVRYKRINISATLSKMQERNKTTCSFYFCSHFSVLKTWKIS